MPGLAAAAGIAAAGTIAASYIGSQGAKDASDAQVQAAETAAQVQKEIYQTNRDDLSIYREVGSAALFELYNLRGELTQPFGAKEFFEGVEITPLPSIGESFAALGAGDQADVRKRLEQINTGIEERKARIAEGPSPGRNINNEIRGLEQERTKLLLSFPSQSRGVPGPAGSDQPLQFPGADSPEVVNFRDPGYDFRIEQGEKAIRRNARAVGGLTGATFKGLQEFGQQSASAEFQNAFNRFQSFQGNRFNRLAALAGIGQSATNTSANLGVREAALASDTILERGRAQAQGDINQANVLGAGVSSLTNQALMFNQFGGGQQQQQYGFSPATTNTFAANQSSGGQNAQFFRNI